MPEYFYVYRADNSFSIYRSKSITLLGTYVITDGLRNNHVYLFAAFTRLRDAIDYIANL